MKIAILSRNVKLYSTRRMVEAAQARGHEVAVLDHLKCDLVIEAGQPSILYKGLPLSGFDAVSRASALRSLFTVPPWSGNLK